MRRHRIRAGLVTAVALCAAAVGASEAQAKLQHVDVYEATLELRIENNATSSEDGWSQTRTDLRMHGVLRARVGGLEFVDGVPSQGQRPFEATNATELSLFQQTTYTSPLGVDEGTCHQSATEARPEDPGSLITSVGARDDDGSERIGLGVTSPSTVWILKSCDGYLKYEVANPLIGKGMYAMTYVPVGALAGGEFDVPLEGLLDCPDFIRETGCQPYYRGKLHFERTASYDRGQPDPPAGTPGGAPLPPPITPLPAHPTDAQIDQFGIDVLVRAAREDPYTQAVVRCGRPCEGHVSAYAIALSKQGKPTGRTTRVGRTTFRSTTGGAVKPRIRLSPSEADLVRRRGAVQLRADATPLGGGTTVRTTAVGLAR